MGGPPKTPDNSSVPPSRGQKRNRPARQKKPRKTRDGPGTTRDLAENPDRVVDRHAETCAHCGTALPAATQSVRHAYDHIDLPPMRPVVTRVRLFGCRCPHCRRRARGTPPEAMPPGSPFEDTILVLLTYLRHHHAIAYERLARLMGELFGLLISEGAIAIGRRRDDIKDSALHRYHAEAERRLDRVLAIPVTTEAGRTLLAQTKRWRGAFFTFLQNRDVPPTNNGSEQALRPSVIFRKVTNGFRSAWGADTHARTRSVIGTGRLNDIPAHQAISRALGGQPVVLAWGPA